MTKLDIAMKVAFHYLGTPYIWSGDDFSGFDCSGFVIEILKSVGLLHNSGDWTASNLMFIFRRSKVEKPYRGCLVFYGTDRATHVELCISEELSIGASGGNSDCTSIAKAMEQNAYIKIRPINRRNDILGYFDLFKEVENG